MPNPDIVTIKFPLYLVEKGQRDFKGGAAMVEPFAELHKYFKVSSQTFIPRTKPQVYLGLRVNKEGQDQIEIITTENDPIRLYRALNIVTLFDRFDDPHQDLRDADAAAGFNIPLRFHHYVRNRVKGIIGNGAFEEVLQAVPPNLQQVIENLRRNRVQIEGRTLQREIRKGQIESNPLYERVIQEAKQRYIRARKALEMYGEIKYARM